MHEGARHSVTDDLRAEDDVTELARHVFGQRLAGIDREGEDVRGLVHAQVLSLQPAHLLGRGERKPEVARFDSFGGQRL